MNLNNRWSRFALAMSVAGIISTQIPLAGGVAMAQSYNPTGGGGGRGLVQGLVLGLVGLGVYSTLSDKGGTTTTPPPTDTSTPPAAITQTTADVFDVSSSNADLSTFASDADKAGVKDQMKKGGPYTVFAPTNAAFASLPGDQLAALQQPENAAKLKTLMQYHIVQGKYTMQDLRGLADGTQLPTLAGSPVTITKQGTNVFVNGVQVIDSDIPASNGVIHPLGSVLTPPAPPATE